MLDSRAKKCTKGRSQPDKMGLSIEQPLIQRQHVRGTEEEEQILQGLSKPEALHDVVMTWRHHCHVLHQQHWCIVKLLYITLPLCFDMMAVMGACHGSLGCQATEGRHKNNLQVLQPILGTEGRHAAQYCAWYHRQTGMSTKMCQQKQSWMDRPR